MTAELIARIESARFYRQETRLRGDAALARVFGFPWLASELEDEANHYAALRARSEKEGT